MPKRDPARDSDPTSLSAVEHQLQAMQRRINGALRGNRDLPYSAVEDRAAYFFDARESEIGDLGWDLGGTRLAARGREIRQAKDALEAPLRYAYACLGVAAHFNFRVSTEWRTSRKQGNLLDVLTELHAHGLQIAEESLSLLESGLPVGASARWRSLFELLVIARVVQTGGDRIAARYKKSHLGERVRTLEELERSGMSESVEATFQRSMRKARAALSSAERVHGSEIRHRHGWAAPLLNNKKPTFASLADYVGLRDERRNRHGAEQWIQYVLTSQHIHAVRASSIASLQAGRVDGIPVFLPKGTATFAGFVDIFHMIDQLTHILARTLHSAINVPSAVYWSYLVHMLHLDVGTEAFSNSYEFDPSFLNRSLGLTEIPQSPST